WVPLDECLRSLAAQAAAPSFEVIIVDDGSEDQEPEFILDWARSFPLKIVQQRHSGIPTARNRGVQIAKGAVLVFVDADCRVQSNCLAALNATITNYPEHGYFQLRL